MPEQILWSNGLKLFYDEVSFLVSPKSLFQVIRLDR